MTELERYKEAMEKAKLFVGNGCTSSFSGQFLREIDSILNGYP